MRDTILYDSALRLFGDHVTPQASGSGRGRRVAGGAVAGGGRGRLSRRAGRRDRRHGRGGRDPARRRPSRRADPAARDDAGALAVRRERDRSAGRTLVGRAGGTRTSPTRYAPVPWGRAAEAVAIVSGSSLRLAARDQLRFEPGASLAGEPRDLLTAIGEGRSAPLPNAVSADLVRGVGALLRAAQMAGAMEAALDLATTYANDRVQFGRPIGKFQAIQQQLALLAEEAAAALVAVESAAISLAEGRQSAEFALRRREDPGRRGGRHGRRDRASGARRDRLHRGTLLALPDPAAVVVARRVRRRGLLGRSARPAHRGRGRRRSVAADSPMPETRLGPRHVSAA